MKSAGFASDAPFTTEGDTNSYLVEGDPLLPPGEMNDALYREVTPGYLETIGAVLRCGRTFDSGDRDGSAQVIVVNEFLAKLHWPGQNALGKRLRFDDPKQVANRRRRSRGHS